MRTFWDRARHAVCFEILGLILVTLLSGWVFETNPLHFGILAIALSVIATLWNYLYNLAFDKALFSLGKSLYKTVKQRVLHAFLFEFGMLVITLPLVMWWLDYSAGRAITMSVSLMLFYLLFTYIYNWIYDQVFPIPAVKDHV